MTAKSTWKQRERDIAGFFFSERTPLSGGNSKHSCSDSLSPDFYVEAKFRAKLSLMTLYRDTEAKARKEGKIPVVALCEKSKHGFLVVVSEKHFKRLATRYMREWCKRHIKKYQSPPHGRGLKQE